MSALHTAAPLSLCHHALVFDSGLGGLSIAREIIAAAPGCRISYLADTAYFPYGTKNDEELIIRIEAVLNNAIGQLAPDIVVIACNTASTLALSHLRQRFNLPFVGVVPAIKPAAALSTTKTLGLLATPATVSRPYTAQLIADFAGDCQVVRFGSHSLVASAEASLCGRSPAQSHIKHELAGLLEQPGGDRIDTIVLACTHFPLLAEALQQAAPHISHWVDSGAAVARQVGVWLGQVAPSVARPGPVQFFSTQAYEQLEIPKVEQVLNRELMVGPHLLMPAEHITGVQHGKN